MHQQGTGVFFPPSLLVSPNATSAGGPDAAAQPQGPPAAFQTQNTCSRPGAGLLFASRQQQISRIWLDVPSQASTQPNPGAAKPQAHATAGDVATACSHARLGPAAAAAAQRSWLKPLPQALSSAAACQRANSTSSTCSTSNDCSPTTVDLTAVAPRSCAHQLPQQQPDGWHPAADAAWQAAYSPSAPAALSGAFAADGMIGTAAAAASLASDIDVWPKCSTGVPAELWFRGNMGSPASSTGSQTSGLLQQLQEQPHEPVISFGEAHSLGGHSHRSHSHHVYDFRQGLLPMGTAAGLMESDWPWCCPASADSSRSLGSATINVPGPAAATFTDSMQVLSSLSPVQLLGGPGIQGWAQWPIGGMGPGAATGCTDTALPLAAAAELKLQQLVTITDMQTSLEAELLVLLGLAKAGS